MRFRIFFLLVTLFFLTMNLLLWRSEFAHQGGLSGPVAPELVLRKILTAPEPSRLVIQHQDRKLGHCTWAPNVHAADTLDPADANGPAAPEGMVRSLAGYTLDLDGNLAIDPATWLRFTLHLRFDTNQEIRELNGSVKLRPQAWLFRADPTARTLTFTHEMDGKRTEQTYAWNQPGHVDRLLHDLGLPLPPGLFAALGLGDSPNPIAATLPPAQFSARHDWLPFGSTRLRVYRLQLDLFGDASARMFIDTSGEILRLELPGSIRLHNDGLLGMK